MMRRTSRRLVSSTSLRELSPLPLGSMPTRASSGAVSSKIRPLDSAMLISAMAKRPRFYRRNREIASRRLLEALYPSTERAQFLFERFIAAIQMIDAVNDGLALGDETGDHEARGGAKIGGHHGGALKLRHPFHHRGIALDRDIGAQALELQGVHEAVFENGLGDERGAIRHRGERHELRLHVGGEARIRGGAYAHRSGPFSHFQFYR